MKFSEMKYERVNKDQVIADYLRLTEQIKNAPDFDTVLAAINEHETISSEFYTMASIAHVRRTIDTRDEFYNAENEFYDQIGPEVSVALQSFLEALLTSPFRPRIEEKYGSLLFKNMEMALKTFSPEVVEDLQKENMLVSEYQKLIASAAIEFDGKTLNIAQLGAYKQNPDRDVRRRAYKAEGGFYMQHAESLDRIFDDLVAVRTTIAQKLGFSSFTELAYLRRTRNCYDADMVARFREQVVQYVVPIVRWLKGMQAERIGLTADEMRIYDDPFGFREGNPTPLGTADDILAAGKRMYEEMSPETAEFIHFMYENELLDVLAKPGKAVGGYCTSFAEYKAPFIFSNFNGTSGDVDVLTHEAGHAYAGYRAMREIELSELESPTMESCECHSMGMEFFAWPWHDLFYGDDADRSRFAHLESTLVFLPYGCLVDHFQHVVYDNPLMPPEERHREWERLEKIYCPYKNCEGVPFYGDYRTWQRQLHIYHYPFYYIDYCLAQTVALKFWQLSQEDYKDAWARYNRFVAEGGKRTFVGLCEAADIGNPFDPGFLEDVAKEASAWIDART